MLNIRQASVRCWQQDRAALQSLTKSDCVQCTLVRKNIANQIDAA